MQPNTESNTDLITVASNNSNSNTDSNIESLAIKTLVALKKFQNHDISLDTVLKLIMS
jgi:hypothetical protein